MFSDGRRAPYVGAAEPTPARCRNRRVRRTFSAAALGHADNVYVVHGRPGTAGPPSQAAGRARSQGRETGRSESAPLGDAPAPAAAPIPGTYADRRRRWFTRGAPGRPRIAIVHRFFSCTVFDPYNTRTLCQRTRPILFFTRGIGVTTFRRTSYARGDAIAKNNTPARTVNGNYVFFGDGRPSTSRVRLRTEHLPATAKQTIRFVRVTWNYFTA